MPKWEVVGGGDKGGILVRKGQDLKSPAEDNRLSTGAVVEQVELVGERLNYKLVTGTGPPTGWVSTKLTGKDLLVPKAEESLASADLPAYLRTEGVATTLKAAAPWVSPVGKAPAKAKVRLVMFNWTGNRGGAGSAHQFIKWPKILGEAGCPAETWEVCQVNYPGRSTRMKEPNVHDATVTITAVADALTKAGTLPTVFFGFSFGGILAYETAKSLAQKGGKVVGLVVASAEHPGWPGRSKGTGPDGGLSKDLSDADFEKVLHEKGGTEVILSNPDMKKMYLPTILGDMTMEETYTAASPESGKLTCPILVFRGAKCPLIARAEADGWLDFTENKDESGVEEFATELVPNEGQPWLSDWYLCQGEPSMQAMIKRIAQKFGGAK